MEELIFRGIAKSIMEERAFRQWYAQQAEELGLSPDPDDPMHFYDWRAAFRAGAAADQSGHWPSEFKREGHPNLFVEGRDTRTGEPATAAGRSRNLNTRLLTSAGKDPRTTEAQALLLSRLAAQDASRLESVTPGRPNPLIEGAVALTPFADAGDIVSAAEEGNFGRAGITALIALLGAAGGVGVGRRLLRGRRAVREASEAADIMQGAEREVFRSIERQARERARAGGQAIADPIAELNRLLQRGPE